VPAPADLGVVERWVLSRHEVCRREVDAALEGYRFDDAAQTVYRFVWRELADRGLELSKESMREGRQGTRSTLLWVLDRTLRLLHPIMPFVTEEVWQRLEAGPSIVVAPWPKEHPEHEDPEVETAFGTILALIDEVLSLRSLIQLGAGYQLAVDASVEELIEPLRPALERLTGAKLEFSAEPRLAGRSIRISVSGVRAAIEVPEEFDPEPAIAVRRRRLAEVDGKLEQSDRKLANPQFLERAKPEAVDRERANHTELQQLVVHLREELEQLERIEHSEG
jgi:valyl-tRNA synthetase